MFARRAEPFSLTLLVSTRTVADAECIRPGGAFILAVVNMATGHRVRWVLIWELIAGWFLAMAANWFGNSAHLLLLAAIALLVYELLIPESA